MSVRYHPQNRREHRWPEARGAGADVGPVLAGAPAQDRRAMGCCRSCHARRAPETAWIAGPVDDAFMDSFVIVRPTREPQSAGTGAWVKAEMDRAIREWRRQFRGDAQVRNDSEITDADIASSNLVLWGDPSSNRILARIADRLPIKWTAQSLELGAQKFDAATHAPILIYPNPLNPTKYVVLN